tara:strand:+ start:297 stop:821 length:525 start_codon:yes stop_codon:yes gene_type:complete
MSIKGVPVELFVLKQTKVVTKKVFDDNELFEDEYGAVYYVEHSMIGLELNLFRPMLISRSEMPIKGDSILCTDIAGSGEDLITVSEKSLSNKDVYDAINNKKNIFKIILKHNELALTNYLENIKKGSWVHGQQFFVECENSVYDKNRLKEVDYNLYDSSLNIFKVKEPIIIHLF